MEHKSRSISNEITFDQDVGDYAVLRETLLGLSHQITFRLLKKGWSSKTLALKIRLDNFSTSTIQVTQDNAFTSAEEVCPGFEPVIIGWPLSMYIGRF